MLGLNRPKCQILTRDEPYPAGANRNYGIARAQGKYICCLDADDRLAPTYLEKAVFLLELYCYDVVSTAIQFFGNRCEFIGVAKVPELSLLLHSNPVTTCAVFKRSMWAKSGGFRDTAPGQEYAAEDWSFWVRLAALGAKFVNIDGEALFFYRSHGAGSLSNIPGNRDWDRQSALIRAMQYDVISPDAIERSRAIKARPRRAKDGLVNLRGRTTNVHGSPTILIAMPFLILGGAERLLSQIARHLVTAGWRVIVLTTIRTGAEHGDTTSWFEVATKEIYHLPKFLDQERWEDFVDYTIISKNVDVLWIVGSKFLYDLLPRIKAKRPQLKVVDLLFNTIGHVDNNRKYRRHIDCILIENDEVRQWLLQRGEEPHRIQLIESGVDLQAFEPGQDTGKAAAVIRRQDGDFVVGFSGRWSEEKDPLGFVHIAEKLASNRRMRFVMTGTGALRGSVLLAIEKLGEARGRFHLAGEVADVRPFLGSFDVLVLPSVVDGRPMVVLEALAMGVPVVASCVGGLPVLIEEGRNGFLCEPGNVEEFVDRLMSLEQDRALHAAMQISARRFAELHLDARSMLAAYARVFERMVDRATSDHPQSRTQVSEMCN